MGQDESLPPGAPKPGEIFAGKYAIEGVLGMGGMGYVLAATHIHLKERVAIKFLLPERAKQPETVARFLREGRAAVKIRSEHVARVLDVGTEGDAPYLVMEYLEGRDLANALAEQERLPHEVAVDYVLQACEAIAEAHAMGTVHRDLKPANLFVARRADGRDIVKVLDFGISKTRVDADDGVMTKTTATVGTPLYMSPEQLTSSKDVDTRTDIWSLGVIAFELLAGRPPFRAESLAELGARVLTMDAPDVRDYAPATPAPLAEAVARCLRRDVTERYPTLAELATAFAPFGTDEARRSAESIVQILAKVARPTSLGPPKIVLTPRRSTGAITDSTWGSRSDTVATDRTASTPARFSTTTMAVALAVLAIVGIGVGAGVRRLSARNGDSAVSHASASAVASAAPSTPAMPASVAVTTTSTDTATNDAGAAKANVATPATQVRVITRPTVEKPATTKPETTASTPTAPATPPTASAPPKQHKIDPTNPYAE